MRPLARTPWIEHHEPRSSAQLRLFCLPFAGGSAHVYRGWVDFLSDRIEICPLQPPGRSTRIREAPYVRLGPLIDELIGSLTDAFAEPFALFGHSLGALQAFELTRALRRRGLPAPELLAVSGMSALNIAPPAPELGGLSDEEFVDRIAHRYGAVPAVVRDEPDLLALLMPVLRADFELYAAYRYEAEAPLDVPIAAFGGLDDPIHAIEAVAAWSTASTRPVTVDLFDGGHFFLIDTPEPVVRTLSDRLARAVSAL